MAAEYRSADPSTSRIGGTKNARTTLRNDPPIPRGSLDTTHTRNATVHRSIASSRLLRNDGGMADDQGKDRSGRCRGVAGASRYRRLWGFLPRRPAGRWTARLLCGLHDTTPVEPTGLTADVRYRCSGRWPSRSLLPRERVRALQDP